jgi:Xaa-Pro aminopeptidase
MISAEAYADRRQRAAMATAALSADGLVVSALVNIRYLTGFTGSNGLLLVDADGSGTLLTDGRYRDQAEAETGDEPVVVRDLVAAAAERITGRWLCETHVLTVDEHRALADAAEAELVPGERLIEHLREVKDDAEVAALEKACAISVEALRGLLGAGGFASRSERQVARDLEQRMYALGAEAIAFDTILASGSNSAIPHHRPTDRVLQRGDFVKIDFGARVHGYHADCTRTFVVGPASAWQKEVHGVVQAAQAAGVAALRTGAPLNECDRAAREILSDAGWLEYFTTGIGHGVGLEIHEDPFVGRRDAGTLAAGTALTMEPGIYVPGRGGVRIEDTVIVGGGADGQGPRVLTPTTTDLLEIA